MSHFRGADFGNLKVSSGYEGFWDDITGGIQEVGNWITGAGQTLEQTGAGQLIDSAGNLIYAGGSTPSTVTQPSNVSYPGLPPGSVPAVSPPGSMLGLDNKTVLYASVGLGLLGLLIILMPRGRRRESQTVYMPAPQPAMAAPSAPQAINVRITQPRSRVIPSKRKRANARFEKGMSASKKAKLRSLRNERKLSSLSSRMRKDEVERGAHGHYGDRIRGKPHKRNGGLTLQEKLRAGSLNRSYRRKRRK